MIAKRLTLERTCQHKFVRIESWEEYAKGMDKEKFNAEMIRLRQFEELSDGERVLFAMSLSATPDERWKRHENFLRSHGLFKHSARKRSGFR